MRIDAVFSGGGVKAFAYVGVLESIEKHQLKLERVAGTSAGAIISALIAARYTNAEIEQIIRELDVKLFMDPPILTRYFPFMKWGFLYFQMGIYKGDKLEEWLTEILAAKNIRTFKDLKEGYLKIVASDLSLGRLVVFPDDLMPHYGLDPNLFPVAKAVRMSAGFPYFFMPKKLPGKTKNKSIIVDGGLLSNFPLWIFGRKQQLRPVLGVKLTEEGEMLNEPQTITNALNMFHALFLTMKKAHDMRYISKAEENKILFVPVQDLAATDFNLSEEKKLELAAAGKKAADRFLRSWSG
ncbi:patatin-like phospholipase family protein [Oceanobacillus alkalisoli]|uniref:patatin-like phospholipase family protein n=1 Tax=Oceanobacillus alkalisoli TaxID=2925113 RepID=UPI001EEFA17C|nr:patatin-like phospholipase family protein [Oceanobacillus alkalisoli]MCF3941746.1 patatin-like phospholipase family protein [Oceanobacillus alkalisoli]MCG5103027.1 patatin-like phospholipase family protein [Oceanobacillus alkalisoli]